MECNSDDVGNDRDTAQLLALGTSFSSDLNIACGDEDLFRMEVELGRRYRIYWNSGSSAETELLDSRGWNFWDYSNTSPEGNFYLPNRTFTFVATQSEDYFFRIKNRPEGNSDIDYRVSYSGYDGEGSIRRDIETPGLFRESVSGGVTKMTFSFVARTGHDYALEIVAAEGVDPWIGTQNGGTNIYSAGSGNTAKLEFTAEGGQPGTTYYTTVGASNPGEFSIKLTSLGDDHAVGTRTTSRLPPNEFVVGDVETGGDIDWFRASLTAGEFYRVKLTRHGRSGSLGTPLLIVRDPASELVDVGFTPPPLENTRDSFLRDVAGAESWFQAESTGDHFLIARSKISDANGFYQLSYERTRAPITRKFQSEIFEEESVIRFDLFDDSPVPISDFFSAPDASSEYQIFSRTAEFLKGSVAQPAGVVHSVVPGELDQWSFEAGEFGTQEIMIRAQTGGKWSQWLKTPVVSRTPESSLFSGTSWPGTTSIGYSFSQTLPSYFEGVYEGFEALAPYESSGLANNLKLNSWNFPNRPPRHTQNEDAVIQVFIADNVDGYYDVYPPGEGRGGDIIFNSEFYDVETELRYGSREATEAIRALGEAVGLKTNPNIPQTESIMGDMSSGVYAVEFMPQDFNVLRAHYQSIFGHHYHDRDPEAGYIQNRTLGVVPNYSIGSSSITDPVQIDLRTGGQSFNRMLPEEDRSVTVVGNGNIFTGRSGSGNDLLFGNGRNNVLDGNSGDDYLAGFSGDDSLRGGNGSDWYGYRFGDGNDTITEGPSVNGNWPGIDTIRLQGFGPFDLGELEESIEFQRTGTDLHINLSFDGGLPEGSVTVEKQAWGSYSVETIELFQNGVRSSPRISLKSVFSQLADGETKRFQTTNDQDNFGLLVTPI